MSSWDFMYYMAVVQATVWDYLINYITPAIMQALPWQQYGITPFDAEYLRWEGNLMGTHAFTREEAFAWWKNWAQRQMETETTTEDPTAWDWWGKWHYWQSEKPMSSWDFMYYVTGGQATGWDDLINYITPAMIQALTREE